MNEGRTAVLSPELYKAIITVVDERVKDIRVTREDFNERHLHIYVYDLERKFFIVAGEEVEINLYGIGKKEG
jgi:hypothetical protein